MFFASGFTETDRRASCVGSEENDILRDLLLDNEFISPRQLPPTPAKHYEDSNSSSNPTTTNGLLKHSSHQVDVSFSQICFDNSPHLTRLQPLSSRSCASFLLPNQSPLSASVTNAIVSPPRVFVQEFACFPQQFFQDNYTIDSDMRCAKDEDSTVSFFNSCLPPAPLPMLTMPPFKKQKLSTVLTSTIAERKQLRCKYPNCPNLRRSAGFCNRHSGKMCSVLGCNKSALSRGKCPEHGGGSRCKNDGCSKFAQTRGLCKSHGGGRQCNISGCSKNAHQNRLCRSHGGGKRCHFFGCPKWAQRSGYCCAHTKVSVTDALKPSGGSQHSLPNNSAINSLSPASSRCIPPTSVSSPILLSPHRLFSLIP